MAVFIILTFHINYISFNIISSLSMLMIEKKMILQHFGV